MHNYGVPINFGSTNGDLLSFTLEADDGCTPGIDDVIFLIMMDRYMVLMK